MTNWVANIVLKHVTQNTEAQIVTMIIPTKFPTMYTDTLLWIIEGTLTMSILLAYIPVVYRTVFRIVFEKSTRAKETMRIMGMSDVPYWVSWLVIYTLSNTLITTLMVATSMINVVKQESALMFWIILWIFG
jgi:ABC-type polysaccharide transport system permease subunit